MSFNRGNQPDDLEFALTRGEHARRTANTLRPLTDTDWYAAAIDDHDHATTPTKDEP